MAVKKSFEEAKVAVESIEYNPDDLNPYVDALIGLSKEQKRVILESVRLEKEQQDSIKDAIAVVNRGRIAEAARVAEIDESILVEKFRKKSLDELTKSQIKHIVATTDLTKAQQKQVVATLTGTAANKGFSISFKTLAANAKAALAAMMTNPVTIISAISTVVSLVISAFENAKRKAEELSQEATEAANAANKQRESLSDLINEYKELAEAGDFDHSARERARDIQAEIAKLVGDQADNLDLVNGKLDDQISKLSEISAQTAEENKNALETKLGDAQKQFDLGIKANGTDTNFLGVVDDLGVINEVLQEIGHISDKWVEIDGEANLQATLLHKNAEEVLAVYKELQDVLLNNDDWKDRADDLLGTDSQTILNGIQAKIELYQKIIEDYETAQHNFLENEVAIAGIDSQKDFDSYIESVRRSTDYTEEQKQLLVEIASETFPEFTRSLKQISTGSLPVYVAQLSKLTDVLSQVETLTSALDKAETDMADGGGLSVDTIEALASAEENYLDYLYEENGVVKLNTEAWKANADAKMLGEMDEIQKEIDSLVEQNDLLRERLKIYEDQQILGDADGEYAKKIAETSEQIEENSTAIEENQDLLRIYKSLYNQISKDGENAFGTLTDELSKLTAKYDLLNSAQEEFAKSGALSASTLSSIVDKFPGLQDSVDLYIAGLITTEELLDDLSVAYGNDVSNYQSAIAAKLETSAEFYNSLSDDQKKLIDSLAQSYGVDLDNFQTVEQKKLAFQAEIIKQLALNYSKYASASLEGLKAEQDAMLISANYDSAELKAVGNAINAIDRMNYAMKQIVAGSGIVKSFNPKKFAGGSSSSSKKSGSSKSKEVEEYIADIDAYRDAVECLRKTQVEAENLESEIENAGAYEKKIALQKDLIEAYKAEQAALHSLNNARDTTITDNVAKLRDLGFAVEYNADTNELWIENLEHLNKLQAKSKGKYDSVQEATNALRQETEDLIDATTELNESNREGSGTWHELQHSIDETTVAMYENAVQASQNAITLAENGMDNAIEAKNLDNIKKFSASIVAEYQAMQQKIHEEAEYYRSQGYSDTSDEVSKLSDLWWDYEANIKAVKQKVVDYLIDMADAAHDLVDEIQSVSDTLYDAAQEIADNEGWMAVETYQAILKLGPQYMQMLKDENGMLVINEERINAVIEARTRQLAVEKAMSYVERIRLAAMGQSNENLDLLCSATVDATNATWGLVYAELALLRSMGKLTEQQYNDALFNIQAMESLAENAVSGIGKTAGAAQEKIDEMRESLEESKESLEDLKDELEDMQDGCNDLIDYVMDMLKDKIEQQIDALEAAKDAVKDYVNELKEAAKAQKDEADYEDEVAEKLKEIAKLQARIDALSPDDSRKAQAEKMSLEEELAELQKDLADTQAEHATDVMEDALDKQYDAYAKEKDDEIDKLKESISSTQKLYDMA